MFVICEISSEKCDTLENDGNHNDEGDSPSYGHASALRQAALQVGPSGDGDRPAEHVRLLRDVGPGERRGAEQDLVGLEAADPAEDEGQGAGEHAAHMHPGEDFRFISCKKCQI